MINRYLVGFAVVILLMITGIILIFGGGGPSPSSFVKIKPLPDYSDTYAQVSMTTDGRINGEDVHRAIRVTVDQYQRRLDVLAGYSENIVQTQTFSNTEKAYDVFLRAIRDAGFMVKKKGITGTAADERGKCPLGFRYIFELNDSGDRLSYLWSSSCGKKLGTLGGSSSLLQSLFKAQITDYSKLTSSVRL